MICWQNIATTRSQAPTRLILLATNPLINLKIQAGYSFKIQDLIQQLLPNSLTTGNRASSDWFDSFAHPKLQFF